MLSTCSNAGCSAIRACEVEAAKLVPAIIIEPAVKPAARQSAAVLRTIDVLMTFSSNL
jgi:hypothetical protein